jgi:soluble lytic murein transglycosylase-like protein
MKIRAKVLIMRFLLIQWSVFFIMNAAHLHADIYYYEDRNGVLHFSNVPVDPHFRFKSAERYRVYIYEDNHKKYDMMIEDMAKKYQLDPRLLKAIVKVESDFNPLAISEDGAMGLMQLMPEKARELRVKNAFNPSENLEAGARYLSDLLRKYSGDLHLALAAYNAGEEAVNTYQGVPPYPETQDYIYKVQSIYYGGE